MHTTSRRKFLTTAAALAVVPAVAWAQDDRSTGPNVLKQRQKWSEFDPNSPAHRTLGKNAFRSLRQIQRPATKGKGMQYMAAVMAATANMYEDFSFDAEVRKQAREVDITPEMIAQQASLFKELGMTDHDILQFKMKMASPEVANTLAHLRRDGALGYLRAASLKLQRAGEAYDRNFAIIAPASDGYDAVIEGVIAGIGLASIIVGMTNPLAGAILGAFALGATYGYYLGKEYEDSCSNCAD